MPPTRILAVQTVAQASGLALFLGEGAVVAWVTAHLRAARLRAEVEARFRNEVEAGFRKESEQRAHLLAGVSCVLASSSDYRVTLPFVARLAVPLLADFCVIGLLNEEASDRPVAVAHVDPAREAQGRSMALDGGPR